MNEVRNTLKCLNYSKKHFCFQKDSLMQQSQNSHNHQTSFIFPELSMMAFTKLLHKTKRDNQQQISDLCRKWKIHLRIKQNEVRNKLKCLNYSKIHLNFQKVSLMQQSQNSHNHQTSFIFPELSMMVFTKLPH